MIHLYHATIGSFELVACGTACFFWVKQSISEGRWWNSGEGNWKKVLHRLVNIRDDFAIFHHF